MTATSSPSPADDTTIAFAELVRGRRVEAREEPREVGAALVALTLRLAALQIAIGRGLLKAGPLRPALEALAPHPLFRFGARGPFEGVAADVADLAFARLASFAVAPLEALGAAYEQLIGAGFSRADAATLVVEGRPVDLERLVAISPPLRADHLAGLIGSAPSARVRRALAEASTLDDVARALERRAEGHRVSADGLVVERTLARRRAGSHYTPPELAEIVADAALAPLLARADPLELRVCDPAMGAGAILFAAASALERAGARRADVVARCLFGVDRDPLAVAVARFGLWLYAGEPGPPHPTIEAHFCLGDALLGARRGDVSEMLHGVNDLAVLHRALDASLALAFWPAASPPDARALVQGVLFGELDRPDVACALDVALARRFLHLEIAFPEVTERGGFDAVIGNPPWVAYAGRAAQPLDELLRRYYTRAFRSFGGYRTLHGLFVERAVEMTRPGGRVGLVLPTSVADLAGYAKVRAAHDALAEVDGDLPDFGADRFDGVFQPAMALLSTHRAAAVTPGDAPWPLASAAFAPDVAALVARLARLEPLPASLFGERGVQTEGDDVTHLIEADRPCAPHTFAVREGRDVGPFCARPPRLYLDPSRVRARLRPAEDWREVKLLIRQTARYPMAALADGTPFRNSVLAAFEHPAIDPFALLAYLNASAVRWLHFVRFRDARQGMPQLKIAHLRATPRPPSGDALTRLAAFGRRVGERNSGLDAEESGRLDDLVAEALALDDHERALVAVWSRDNPPPTPRG